MEPARPVYLDCNATTPLDPRVREAMWPYFESDFGNAGSHTHVYGQHAAKAVRDARTQIAECLGTKPRDVIFTSGATESTNIALFGVAKAFYPSNRPHILSTAVEHKGTLEPLEQLREMGYEVTLVEPRSDGLIDADTFLSEVRTNTVLISLQHVNNELGVIHPIAEIADGLNDHPALIHVDAAQGFGKEQTQLGHPRFDLISLSAHKIYGPKGVGALVRRSSKRTKGLPKPIYYGGGQEQGLRPGTLPVPLIVGFGKAVEVLNSERDEWLKRCETIRNEFLEELNRILSIQVNGDLTNSLPNTLNLAIEDFTSDSVMLALRDVVAVSNGSACTSESPEPSHVLLAMGQTKTRAEQAVRFSWCHLTPEIPYREICDRLSQLK